MFLAPFGEVNTANTVIKHILNIMQSKCVMTINSFNPHKNPIPSIVTIISIFWKGEQRHKK